jgi:hypothetical protein
MAGIPNASQVDNSGLLPYRDRECHQRAKRRLGRIGGENNLEGIHNDRQQESGAHSRYLIVLDGEGKERIVIASPLPDPIVNGKLAKRRFCGGAVQRS